MQPFQEILSSDRILVVDGAMGTMLYAKGVYINRCYDELNLSNPDLVREIHTEYIRAGADIIETNTFGATAHKLQQYGLEANMHEINAIAAKVAREAAGERAYVAGAIGPLGLRIEPYGPTSFAEARELFKAQAVALLEGGVDLFCLETFSDVSEIRQAIAAVRELCDLPIIAQMTIMTDGNTMFGTTPELFTERLDEWGADVIGLNCGVGPGDHSHGAGEDARGHEEEAVSTAKRRTAARRARAPVLHVLARVHVEVCEAIYPIGRKVYRRLLRYDARTHQADLRLRARRFTANISASRSVAAGRRQSTQHRPTFTSFHLRNVQTGDAKSRLVSL